jgi:predicted AlkP superfamily phosphohydrolase/phosphomutase
MKKRTYAGIFIIFTAVIALYFFYKHEKKIPINPVIVIGLDGADWNILNPLLRKGELPNLNRLIKGGSSGVLHTIRPTKSPVIWTSIATGKTMLKHGVLDWTYVKKNNIEIPYNVDDRKVKAVWKILSEQNFSVGSINWYCTFPAEKVNGYVISDRFRIGVDKFLDGDEITFPPELNKKLYPKVIKFKDKQYGRLKREEKIVDFLNKSRSEKIEIPQNRDIQLRRFRRYFIQDKSIENVSLFLLNTVPVDFFAVYFRLIDTTSHFASIFIKKGLRNKWATENKKLGGPSPETEKMLYEDTANIMKSIYRYMDNIVGRIIEKAEGDTIFVVISDHGFNFSIKGYNHYGTPEIPHGIIILNGPGIKSGYKISNSHVYDITPTLLHLFGLPVARDMDGKVILSALEKKRKVRYIQTYETETLKQKHKKERKSDKKVMEDLKSLGYIK